MEKPETVSDDVPQKAEVVEEAENVGVEEDKAKDTVDEPKGEEVKEDLTMLEDEVVTKEEAEVKDEEVSINTDEPIEIKEDTKIDKVQYKKIISNEKLKLVENSLKGNGNEKMEIEEDETIPVLKKNIADLLKKEVSKKLSSGGPSNSGTPTKLVTSTPLGNVKVLSNTSVHFSSVELKNLVKIATSSNSTPVKTALTPLKLDQVPKNIIKTTKLKLLNKEPLPKCESYTIIIDKNAKPTSIVKGGATEKTQISVRSIIKPSSPMTSPKTIELSPETPKRKRGRPAKNSTPGTTPKPPPPKPKPSTLDPNTPKRRRGRPSLAEQKEKAAAQTQNQPSESSPERTPTPPPRVTSSKYSQRRRKDVNYFALANPTKRELSEGDDDDDDDEEVLEEDDISSEEEVKPKRRARRKRIKVDDDSMEFHSPIARRQYINPKNPMLKKSQEENDEDDEDGSDSEQKEKPRRGKKPSGTSFLNGLFTTFVKNVITPNEDGCSEGDEEVKCMQCRKLIKKELWENHKTDFHNNLTWNDKEPALDLKDMDFVEFTLIDVLNKKNSLHCDKCGHIMNSVKGFLKHWKNCESSSLNTVVCAVCKIDVIKTAWGNHKLKHNNLAWRVGDEPIDLSNQTVVMSILNGLYKKKVPLRCELCNQKKKSVVGFLSHRAQCSKSKEELEDLKVKCPHCDVKVMSVSMATHIKSVHTKTEKPAVVEVFEKKEGVSSRRSAAKKALDLISSYKKTNEIDKDHKHLASSYDFEDKETLLDLIEEHMEDKAVCYHHQCNFETNNAQDFLDHIQACSKKPSEVMICKRCLFTTNLGAEKRMNNHLRNAHRFHNIFGDDEDFAVGSSEESEDDYIDDDPEHNSLRQKLTSIAQERSKAEVPTYKRKPNFILPCPPRVKTGLFSKASTWTLEFRLENYSEKPLFNNLRCDLSYWSLLYTDGIEDYLPSLYQSCEVAYVQTNKLLTQPPNSTKSRKFDVLQLEKFDNGESLIFCGGPISTMTWLPTSDLDETDQLLAVSVVPHAEREYEPHQTYDEPSIIQFWNFGKLRNKVVPKEKPYLAFSIAVDYGPVWYLEWCPSGCYDHEETEVKRLGLLAVAGSDSCVYIYSIIADMMAEKGLFYKGKPVAQLQLELSPEDGFVGKGYYATRISWSNAAEHHQISVGYSNGIVAIFDLSTESKLLRIEDDADIKVILPWKNFQAHVEFITALDLYHLNDGKRWLLTASADKSCHIWDLETDSKIMTFKRNMVKDGSWMTHWISCIVSCKSTRTNNTTHTSSVAARNFLSECAHLTSSTNILNTVSTSDWLNVIMYANSGGDVLCFQASQLLHGFHHVKQMHSYTYLCSYAKVISKEKMQTIRNAPDPKSMQLEMTDVFDDKYDVDRNEEKKEEPEEEEKIVAQTYEELQKSSVLVLSSLNAKNTNDFPENMSKYISQSLSKSNTGLYPFEGVTKIAINTNKLSSTFYAVGYQAGFVRLSSLRFFNDDSQVL